MLSLDALVYEYASVKETIKSNEAISKKCGAEIKQRLLDGETVTDKCAYTAKITIVDTSYFDEDKLIAKLKELGYTNCIKTKEYVDMDLLENEIYQGTLTAEMIKDCKVKQEQTRLNVNKKKEVK